MEDTLNYSGYIYEHSITLEDISVVFIKDGVALQSNDKASRNANYNNLHTHAFGELFCCVSGEVRIDLGRTVATLSYGDFLYVPAHFPHVSLISQKEGVSWASGIKLLQPQGKTRRKSSEIRAFLSPLFQSRHPLILKNKPAFVEAVNAMNSANRAVFALQFLSLLTRMVQMGFEELPVNSNLEGEYSGRDLSRIALLEYIIDSRFMTPVSRQETAEMLFISTRQLERICKKRYGMTFRERIMHCRMISAAHMLIETNDTIETIAIAVGFASKTSFYKEFEKKYGITPLQYRHKHR